LDLITTINSTQQWFSQVILSQLIPPQYVPEQYLRRLANRFFYRSDVLLLPNHQCESSEKKRYDTIYAIITCTQKLMWASFIYRMELNIKTVKKTHTTTVLWPFFQDHPGEPVPEQNFWTLWCKERFTEADTLTIRQGATPSGLTGAHLHHPPIFFYGADALPATQPTVSKHWRQLVHSD